MIEKWHYVGYHTAPFSSNDDRFLVKDCIEFHNAKEEANAYLEACKAKDRSVYWVCVETWVRASYKGERNTNTLEG